VQHQSGPSLYGRVLFLPAISRRGRERLARGNALAYFASLSVTNKKSLYNIDAKVNNAGPNEAAFKLLQADDVKNDAKNDKIKIVDDVPTDNTDESTAGFRLPVDKKAEPQQRVIEVLVAEEEEDLTPGFKKSGCLFSTHTHTHTHRCMCVCERERESVSV